MEGFGVVDGVRGRCWWGCKVSSLRFHWSCMLKFNTG